METIQSFVIKAPSEALSLYSGLSMYHGRKQHDMEHNTKGRKLKLRTDYELTKYTPYFALTGEVWGIFSVYFREKYSKM